MNLQFSNVWTGHLTGQQKNVLHEPLLFYYLRLLTGGKNITFVGIFVVFLSVLSVVLIIIYSLVYDLLIRSIACALRWVQLLLDQFVFNT